MKPNALSGVVGVAVKGGTGLIGSFLADEFVAVGARVVIIDDCSKGSRANFDGVADRIGLQHGTPRWV